MNPITRAFEYLTRKSYEVLFYNDPLDETRERMWGKRDFLKANEISLYTNRAVEKRAEKVSEVEFFLVKRGTEDVVEDHPLLDVLRKPNGMQTGRQFWGLYQKYKDLLGEAYIWVERGSEIFDKTGKNIKGLHLLRPDLVKRNYSNGEITSYTYSKP